MEKNDIYVLYGQRPREMMQKLLETIQPETLIQDKNALIGIKPNLVVAREASSGATTHPELVEGVIVYLKEQGYQNLMIMEGSWVGDRTSIAFDVCGYTALARKYNVKLVDLQKDSSKTYDVGGVKMEFCNQAMAADFIINMPVLKGHCQTSMTCALKNMKGCITNKEKRHFHTMGLHKPIAYLNKLRCADLVLVDGLCGDLDFEEGGNPVKMDRIIAARDSVLVDTYVASLMGFAKEDIEYIGIAEKLGVGSADLSRANIIEENEGVRPGAVLPSGKVRALQKYVDAKDACSACYGSLMHALNRMRERGTLRNVKEKIYIGQGYKGECPNGIGIGACLKNCSKNVKGCPPTAIDIVNFLENNQ